MANKVSTNITLDPQLKKEAIELFSELGMDLSTAISIFLKQAVLVQGIPFAITRQSSDAYTRMLKYNELLSQKEDQLNDHK